MRLRQVERDFPSHALLGAGQRKRQRFQQTRHQRGRILRAAPRHARRSAGAPFVVGTLERHLLSEQFLELDAHPGRMRAVHQRGFVGIDARMVQHAHRLHQRRHAERLQIRSRDRFRQQLRQCRACERVVDRLAQIRLAHTRRARIDRCQCLWQGRVFVHHTHGRMHHLHAEEAAAHVAAHPQPCAERHLLDLGAVEIQKAQHQLVAGVVAQFDQQLAARTVSDFVVEHHAFGLRHATRQQVPDRRQ